MHNIILHLTDTTFNEKIINPINTHQKKWFLIDFWAEWCNPCKSIAPILEDIAIEFDKTLIVGKINIDNNPTITKKYDIRSIPTLLLIHNGIVISSKVGLLSKQQLREFLNLNIK